MNGSSRDIKKPLEHETQGVVVGMSAYRFTSKAAMNFVTLHALPVQEGHLAVIEDLGLRMISALNCVRAVFDTASRPHILKAGLKFQTENSGAVL